MKYLFFIYIISACVLSCKEPSRTVTSVTSDSIVASSPKDSGNVSLITYRWKLEELSGRKIDSVNSQEPFLLFNAGDSSINGRLGCNRFGGKYATSGNLIRFSHIYSTKMACPDMWAETTFLGLADSINEFRINEKHLPLLLNGERVATFSGMPLL